MVYSKDKSRDIARQELDRLIDKAGSRSHLARMLTHQGYEITPQAVQNWHIRGQISAPGALAVVEHPEFCEHFILSKLRPDITAEEWHDLREYLADQEEG